ncbi:MAG: N-acetyltransferase [Quadrisphaera sp.]
MSAPVLRPMRWWDVEPLLPVEAELFGASAWSAETFWSELAAPGRTYLVAVEDDDDGVRDRALLGYAGLALAGPDADVQTLAVAPHAQRRGVGGLLLDALVRAARDGGRQRGAAGGPRRQRSGAGALRRPRLRADRRAAPLLPAGGRRRPGAPAAPGRHLTAT